MQFRPRELGELAGRYRGMAEELLDMQSHAIRVEKLAGIGCLAAGVAHEVRNPLGALGTYVEVLRKRGSDPDVTSEMHTAIARVDRIVQGLLDYARPSGHAPGRADRFAPSCWSISASSPPRRSCSSASTRCCSWAATCARPSGR